MARLTFQGGIHPYDGKDLSKEKPIKPMLSGKELVYPLSQHIGAPAAAVVKKGDQVKAGQMIAEANGFVSVPIYSSVSGTVKNIEARRTPTGDMVPAIIIENDGEYQEVLYQVPPPYESASRQEIIERVRQAGVVGMGGAGFPAHVKFSPKEPDKITDVIINCAECEPYLTSDYRRMLEEPEKLVEGLRIILSLFDHAAGTLAVEDNKPDCIKVLQEQVKGDARIRVQPLQTKYPQGAERALIFAVTGRKLNSNMLPADVGCIVNNVDTAVAVYQAVVKGEPLIQRIVTVTGDAVREPGNFLVRTGTNYQELVDAAGGWKAEPAKLISGGPMMGFALFSLDVPTTKTSSALLCLTEDEVAKRAPSACINCGKCVEVCPARILPARLSVYADHGEKKMFLSYEGMECCECGCCSYVCPAKRGLSQSIKSMRKMILADRRKGAK